MEFDMEHRLLTEKYRPTTINDCILPSPMKAGFKKMIEKREIPNLLFYGTSGVGKTTVAKCLVNELDSDYMIINASLQGNIDTLRTDITGFASTVSLEGADKKKYVILDESDYLTPNMMASLRNFMEDFSANCGFILTCNIPERIIDPLKSRLSQFEFNFTNTSEKSSLVRQMYEKIIHILERENIEYEKEAIVKLLKNNYPDLRKTLNEIQKISYTENKISLDFDTSTNIEMQNIVEFMKNKKFNDLRDWVAKHHGDNSKVYRAFYDNAKDFIQPNYIPGLIVCIAEYQHKDYFAVDKEINLAAFLTECMLNFEWK